MSAGISSPRMPWGKELLEDGPALAEGSPLWGKNVFVGPRPHLAKWVAAVMGQMKLEGAGKVLLTCVALRDQVKAGRNVCEVLPALYPLFHTGGISAKAWAVGYRPRVRRVPNVGKALPPQKWDEDFLPSYQVLVAIEVDGWGRGVEAVGRMDRRGGAPEGGWWDGVPGRRDHVVARHQAGHGGPAASDGRSEAGSGGRASGAPGSERDSGFPGGHAGVGPTQCAAGAGP